MDAHESMKIRQIRVIRVPVSNQIIKTKANRQDLHDRLIIKNPVHPVQKKVVKIQKMFKISRQAVHKEIIKLIELNLIEQKGAGKAIHYIIK